jgi:hypothetical protein
MKALTLAAAILGSVVLGGMASAESVMPEPVARADVLGKPSAPVEIDVVSIEQADGPGRFSFEVRFIAGADHDVVALAAWGAEGVRLDGPTARVLGRGAAGRSAGWRLSGDWTGEGPPRVYLQAELRTASGSASRRLAVTVSEAAFPRTTEGRLDVSNGVLLLEIQ